jgi:hypothetical protein
MGRNVAAQEYDEAETGLGLVIPLEGSGRMLQPVHLDAWGSPSEGIAYSTSPQGLSHRLRLDLGDH